MYVLKSVILAHQNKTNLVHIIWAVLKNVCEPQKWIDNQCSKVNNKTHLQQQIYFNSDSIDLNNITTN